MKFLNKTAVQGWLGNSKDQAPAMAENARWAAVSCAAALSQSWKAL